MSHQLILKHFVSHVTLVGIKMKNYEKYPTLKNNCKNKAVFILHEYNIFLPCL